MASHFLFKCYLLGIIANISLGPIFLLTFESAASFGVTYGMASGLAAAIADGLLFSFGMLGALKLIATLKVANQALHLIGAIFLLVFGIVMWFRHGKKPHAATSAKLKKPSHGSLFGRTFLVTALNPLTVGYFGAATVGLFEHLDAFSRHHILLGGVMVALGTLTIMALVSFSASQLKKLLKPSFQVMVNKATAVIFIALGSYLMYIFVTGL